MWEVVAELEPLRAVILSEAAFQAKRRISRNVVVIKMSCLHRAAIRVQEIAR